MRLEYQMTLDYLHHLLEAAPEGLALIEDAREIRWEGGKIALPLCLPLPDGGSLEAWVDSLPDRPPDHVVVLMRAGNASMGYWIEGELAAHKVIRKYMVRKKQGRMQIAYLSTKGKSRAGSRVRLRESLEFFEEINQKLADWIEEYGDPEAIFHSCPVRLKSHWFGSKIAPPFEPDDQRLVHVPFHVHQPVHEELLRIQRLLATGVLTIDE